jgi:hypothetical protein
MTHDLRLQSDPPQTHSAKRIPRGRQRALSKIPREVPTVATVTRKRIDVNFGGCVAPRVVTISLARVVGFFEEEACRE